MKEKSKDAKEVKARARGLGLAAIEVLAEVMSQGDSAATARVSAAKAVLERGFGRVGLAPADEEENRPEFLRIERVIIDPGCHDPELESQYREYRDGDDKDGWLDS